MPVNIWDQCSSVSTSLLVMATARMLAERAIPWLVLYIGLSVETSGEYTGYRHFRFVSETEVQANSFFVPHTPVMLRPDSQFCSTWGNFHFKTFDGGFLQLPSNCTYTFVRQCKGSYEDFNIAIQRQETAGGPAINAFVKLAGVNVDLSHNSISVDKNRWVWVFLLPDAKMKTNIWVLLCFR